MTEQRPTERVVPACRWRTSEETFDVIEALERIEALLIRLEQRLAESHERVPDHLTHVRATGSEQD